MFARVRRAVPTTIVALGAAAALAACGTSTVDQDQSTQAAGLFPASVSARFPARQTLAQNTQLIITVKNTGRRAMPDVAVTLSNPRDGSGAQALGTLLAQPAAGQPILSGRSRPVWVINQAPGPCLFSCHQGGPGADVTAYTNTWARHDSLAPGKTAVFDWHVTAVEPGAYTVAYQVAAGLSGHATATGSGTRGQLGVRISARARGAYINGAGQIVDTN
jgi:hypothetical protein